MFATFRGAPEALASKPTWQPVPEQRRHGEPDWTGQHSRYVALAPRCVFPGMAAASAGEKEPPSTRLAGGPP